MWRRRKRGRDEVLEEDGGVVDDDDGGEREEGFDVRRVAIGPGDAGDGDGDRVVDKDEVDRLEEVESLVGGGDGGLWKAVVVIG